MDGHPIGWHLDKLCQSVKKALILGVTNPQVDAIRYLKQRGFWVIGTSYEQEGPGVELVDRFELIDVRDRDGIADLAHREQVGLIYSVGSSLAITTSADVSHRLGLPSFVDYKTAELLHDKVAFRRHMAASGISPVNFRVVRSEQDLCGFESYPAILKPADSQGQRGVFRGDSAERMRDLVAPALCHSRTKTLILEEYLEGPEISVHTLLEDGEIRCFLVSDRLTAEFQKAEIRSHGIATGHVLPSRECVDAALQQTRKLVEDCIEALGIRRGPVYFQIKLTPAGPRIVEITPRLDGCHIWRLVHHVTGIDLLDATFRLLLEERVELPAVVETTSCARLRFLLSAPNTIFHGNRHVVPPDAAYEEAYYRDGQPVRPVNNHLETVGYYIEKLTSVPSIIGRAIS